MADAPAAIEIDGEDQRSGLFDALEGGDLALTLPATPEGGIPGTLVVSGACIKCGNSPGDENAAYCMHCGTKQKAGEPVSGIKKRNFEGRQVGGTSTTTALAERSKQVLSATEEQQVGSDLGMVLSAVLKNHGLTSIHSDISNLERSMAGKLGEC